MGSPWIKSTSLSGPLGGNDGIFTPLILKKTSRGPAEFVPVEAQKGYVSLIRGLSSSSPTSQEEDRYVSDLGAAIDWQLQQPLSASIRNEIASLVQHLTWTRYTERLFEIYEQAL